MLGNDIKFSQFADDNQPFLCDRLKTPGKWFENQGPRSGFWSGGGEEGGGGGARANALA